MSDFSLTWPSQTEIPALIYLLKWPSTNAFLGMGMSQSTLGNEVTNAELAENPFEQKMIFGITTTPSHS
jgi:hypothetical protein